jgi:hypothetical protein
MPQNVVSGFAGEDAVLLSVDVLLHASQYALRSALNVPHVWLLATFASDVVHIFTKGESMVRAQAEKHVQPDWEVCVSAEAPWSKSARSGAPRMLRLKHSQVKCRRTRSDSD